MAQSEIVRLIEWLRDHGHPAEEILDCIQCIESDRKEELRKEHLFHSLSHVVKYLQRAGCVRFATGDFS